MVKLAQELKLNTPSKAFRAAANVVARAQLRAEPGGNMHDIVRDILLRRMPLERAIALAVAEPGYGDPRVKALEKWYA